MPGMRKESVQYNKPHDNRTRKLLNWKQQPWEYKIINDMHCIGLRHNLDVIEDALIIVSQHTFDGKEAKEIAEWIVTQHNGENHGC
jgi:hypothetical protein